MIIHVGAENFADVDSHRAVEKDWQHLEVTTVFQLPQIVQQRLGPTDCKGWNDDGPAAANGAINYLAQRLRGIAPIMSSITVSRLDHKIVRLQYRLRVRHERIVEASEIARKNHPPTTPTKLDGSGPQDMAGTPQS